MRRRFPLPRRHGCSTRRSQSVKLGYVCSLWHARSESLGNRTLISFFFLDSVFFFFFFFFFLFSFFSSQPVFPLSLSRQPPAIRSPQGKLVFSIARRRAGTKTRGYQPAKSKWPFFQTGFSIILEGNASAPFNRERRAICRSYPRIKLFRFLAESFARYAPRLCNPLPSPPYRGNYPIEKKSRPLLVFLWT